VVTPELVNESMPIVIALNQASPFERPVSADRMAVARFKRSIQNRFSVDPENLLPWME
jgi:hypothetical protein